MVSEGFGPCQWRWLMFFLGVTLRCPTGMVPLSDEAEVVMMEIRSLPPASTISCQGGHARKNCRRVHLDEDGSVE